MSLMAPYIKIDYTHKSCLGTEFLWAGDGPEEGCGCSWDGPATSSCTYGTCGRFAIEKGLILW